MLQWPLAAIKWRAGNYLASSIENAGLGPRNLPDADKSSINFGSGGNAEAKAWKDIWGSGQGIGSIGFTNYSGIS